MCQRALEEGGRVGRVGEQRPAVIRGGERPGPRGATGERGKFLDPRSCPLVVARPHRGRLTVCRAANPGPAVPSGGILRA